MSQQPGVLWAELGCGQQDPIDLGCSAVEGWGAYCTCEVCVGVVGAGEYSELGSTSGK